MKISMGISNEKFKENMQNFTYILNFFKNIFWGKISF